MHEPLTDSFPPHNGCESLSTSFLIAFPSSLVPSMTNFLFLNRLVVTPLSLCQFLATSYLVCGLYWSSYRLPSCGCPTHPYCYMSPNWVLGLFWSLRHGVRDKLIIKVLGQLLLLQVPSCFCNPRGTASCTLVIYNAQIACDLWPTINLNAYDLLCISPHF